MAKLIVVGVAGCCLALSAIRDRAKTKQALLIAARRLWMLLPSFLTVLVIASVVLALIPEERIVSVLGGENALAAAAAAAAVGSVTLIPGFIAYPLGGILAERGVAFMVISAFVTTLMLVGVVTYPVERRHFGRAVTIVRNAIALVVAGIVVVMTGLYFGELRW